MLNTIYQLAAIVGALIPVLGFLWWLISPRLAALSKQVEPDPAAHDANAPTMRAMQEEQTETMHRMESKLDERLNAFGAELAQVKEAVKPIPQLILDVSDLKQRVGNLEQAGKSPG